MSLMIDAVRDLEAELAKRTAQLARAQATLLHQEKMSSLGRLVAGIAHELNNPITFIYGNVDFLGDYLTRLLQLVDVVDELELSSEARATFEAAKQTAEFDYIRADAPNLVSSIRAGAERTAGIVGDLRSFSRTARAELRDVDLAAHIETTLGLIAPLITDRLEVRRKLDGKVPPIVGNPGHLGQVLMNLLVNAAQAVVGAGWIEIGLGIVGEQVAITVCDSGAGLPPDLLDRLGEPFFTTKSAADGTGLGLWITEGIVRAHGGSLTWRNRVGAGAEFTVTLPFCAPDSARGVSLR